MADTGIVAFIPAHLADIDPPVLARSQMQRFAAAYCPAGPAFTLIQKGRALGCAGLILEGRSAKAWAFFSDELRRRPYLLHRTVRRALPALIAHYELKELTAEAHADFRRARVWLERLGLRFDGIAPQFAGTTENYARYCLWVD